MATKKIDISSVPKDLLGDIQALIPSTTETYIAVGPSIYVLSPATAYVVMQSLSAFMELLEETRKRKIEILSTYEIENFKPALVSVTVQDMMSDATSQLKLSDLLKSLLAGVTEEDFNVMTVGQMLDALNKAVTVNLNTLPVSLRQQFTMFTGITDTASPQPASTEITKETGEESTTKNP